MVKDGMLTKEEKAWIKVRIKNMSSLLFNPTCLQEHNQRCHEKLAPQLKDDKRALKWLKREAERGIGLASGPPGIDIDWD